MSVNRRWHLSRAHKVVEHDQNEEKAKKWGKDKGKTNDGITRVSCKTGKEAKQDAIDIFMRQFLWLDSEYTRLGRVLRVYLTANSLEEEGKILYTHP